MDRSWLILYCALAFSAIVQALLMVLQTYEHRRYARRRMEELAAPQAQGRACLLAPCKGVDPSMPRNLQALFQQDYADYEVLFIVESDSDPACAVIRRAMAEHPQRPSRLVVAGRATQGGQKVHNLLFGVATVPREVKYLAFVDSDAQPRREWLRWLLARLDEPGIGATTGYRWFIPDRPTLANHLLYSINSVIALLLGPRPWHFVWGGSWAIRRDTFEALGIATAWQGTLSDDMVVAAVLRRNRLKTVFHPPCMVVSPVDHDLSGMFRFVRRQYMVARYYSPKMWLFALAAATSSGLALLAGLAAALYGLCSGCHAHASASMPTASVGMAPWIALALVSTQYGLGVVRGWMRQDLVHSYFPSLEATLRPARRFDAWFNPLAGLVHWAALIASIFGRHMVWRGIKYRLYYHGPVQRVSGPLGFESGRKQHSGWRKAG